MKRPTRPLLIGILLQIFIEIHVAAAATAPIIRGNIPEPASPPSSPGASSKSPPSNTVSWQAAFWILVALALNAMTQNSSLDRHLPSGILFPMRSSPIVCAVDAIEALFQFFLCVFTGSSFPESAKRVVLDRMWQPPGTRPTANPPVTLGNQHPRTHTIVFVFGVLPQFIKLFAMRGIPLTQAVGAIYLFSFLVIAGLGALARHAGDEAPQSRAIGLWMRGMFWYWAGMAQAGVWAWCASEVLLLNPSQPVTMIWISVLVGLCLCGAIIAAYIPLLSFIFSVNDDTIILQTVIKPMMFPMTLIGVIIPVIGGIMVVLDSSHALLRLQLFAWLPAILFGTIENMRMWSQGSPALGINLNFLIFAAMNLVSLIVCYSLVYDPEGTFKPSWVEVMG